MFRGILEGALVDLDDVGCLYRGEYMRQFFGLGERQEREDDLVCPKRALDYGVHDCLHGFV